MSKSREDVLLGYRETLVRYMRAQTELAVDLVELSRELSAPLEMDDRPLSPEERDLIDRSWEEFKNAVGLGETE